MKQIDELTKEKLLAPHYPQIQRAVFGLYNVISHEYAMIDPEELFKILKNDLPHLISVLDLILADIREGRCNNLV